MPVMPTATTFGASGDANNPIMGWGSGGSGTWTRGGRKDMDQALSLLQLSEGSTSQVSRPGGRKMQTEADTEATECHE